MDLSVEAGAIGLPVRYPLNESPSVEAHPVQRIADLEALEHNDILSDGRVCVFLETMRLMAERLAGLRGGYVIGPFSLAGLLMGATEAAMATLRDPELLHGVLRFCMGPITRYAKAIELAGADVIAVLEPTASFLSPKHFSAFVAPYLRDLFTRIKVPSVLHICGRTTALIEVMSDTGAQGLSLDSGVDLVDVAGRVPEGMVIIGNLDTVTVMGRKSPGQVYAEARDLMAAMAFYPDFVLSSACDLPQNTPLENIEAMITAACGSDDGRPGWLQGDDLTAHVGR